MNLGLVERSVRETWTATLLLGGLAGLMCGILSRALPTVQERFMSRGLPPGLSNVRNAMLGIDSAASGVTEIAYSIAWSHPIMLALLFTHAILYGTRVPAGEIDKGTIDTLLGLPVSRWSLFLSESAGWVINGAFVLGAIFVGSFIGTQWVKPEYHPDWGKMALVLAHLAPLYAVVGCAALLASTIASKRSRAVLTVLTLVVASLLLNFLEVLWEPARRVAWLSILHYYRPIKVLQSGAQWADLSLLGGVAAALWVSAGVVLARRSVMTT